MNVTAFEVVQSGTSARVIVSGTGHPRPMVLSFDQDRTFALAGRMLKACGEIDPAQFSLVMRTMAENFMKIDAASASASPVLPDHEQAQVALASAKSIGQVGQVGDGAVSASPKEEDDLDWLIEHAAALQKKGRDRGLSDELIGSLVHISMGDNALLSLAEGAISRSMSTGAKNSGLGQSPPWRIDTGMGPFIVDVDVERGMVVMSPNTDGCDMTPVESHMLGAALQAASAHVHRAKLTAAAGAPGAPEAG